MSPKRGHSDFVRGPPTIWVRRWRFCRRREHEWARARWFNDSRVNGDGVGRKRSALIGNRPSDESHERQRIGNLRPADRVGIVRAGPLGKKTDSGHASARWDRGSRAGTGERAPHNRRPGGIRPTADDCQLASRRHLRRSAAPRSADRHWAEHPRAWQSRRGEPCCGQTA